MFKKRNIKAIIETPNVKSLSEKIDKLMEDNLYFKEKQEEVDRKNRSTIRKIVDYLKGK